MDRETLYPGADDLLVKRWAKYHMANPQVYESFTLQALKMHAKGFAHYSAWTILTAVRFQYDLKVDRPKGEFKVNNDYIALYARKFLYDYPHMVGFFQLRNMKKRKRKIKKGDRDEDL